MGDRELLIDESEAKSERRGLPPPGAGAPRLTTILRGDELDVLTQFARDHRWSLSTAIRAILREKLFGKIVPF